MQEYSIGVDLGGTNLRAAAIDRNGVVLDKVAGSIPVAAGRDVIVGHIVAAVSSVRQKIGSDGLQGVGIGIPGYIRMETGVVVGSANLPGLEGFPFETKFKTCWEPPSLSRTMRMRRRLARNGWGPAGTWTI